MFSSKKISELKTRLDLTKSFNSSQSLFVVIFMVMQFCMPSFVIYSFWFYLFIAIPTIYIVLKYVMVGQKQILSLIWQNNDRKLLFLLFAYIIIHSLFFYGTLQTIRHSITNLLFVLAMIMFHRNLNQHNMLRFIRLMLWVVVICGIISIAKYVAFPHENGRLIPIGQNNHAILGANIYALFSLMGLCLWRRVENISPNYMPTGELLGVTASHQNIKDKMLVVAAFLVTAILILLTQSRGPLIAFCCSGAVGLLMMRHYKIFAASLIIIAILIADMWFFYYNNYSILPLAEYYEYLLDALHRKSHRLEIWQLAWQLIARQPVFGYGMQATFPYGYAGVNPHNLFISTWYYTGIMGFVLLLAIVMNALVNLYKNHSQDIAFIGFLLLIHGVIACLTDQGQLVKTPSPLWFIFWWPIANSCAISYQNTIVEKTIVEKN